MAIFKLGIQQWKSSIFLERRKENEAVLAKFENMFDPKKYHRWLLFQKEFNNGNLASVLLFSGEAKDKYSHSD